jgi:hypothetical protein
LTTRKEALEVLGVDEDATTAEIQSAFDKQAFVAHPDHGGDDGSFRRLVEARKVALGEQGSALVPIDQIKDLVVAVTQPLVRQAEKAERLEARRQVFTQVVRVHVSPLRAARRKRAELLGAAAGATALTQVIRAFPVGGHVVEYVSLGALAALVYAAAGIGVMIQRISWRIRRIENAIEDANETLSEKAAFVAVFQEIGRGSDSDPPWTRDDLLEGIRSWGGEDDAQDRDVPLPNLVSEIGVRDFYKLLIAKGRELDLIEEIEDWDDDDYYVAYDLRR